MRTKVLVTVFVMGIFVPMIFTFMPSDESTLAELRTKQSAPALPRSRHQLKQYPRNFEKFYQDNFGLRDNILAIYNRLNHSLVRRSKTVIFGKDGWLFFTGNEGIEKLNSETIKDYCGQLQFTRPQLEQITARLVERTIRFRSMGIEYWWVIAPNKHTIYPQFLPITSGCLGKTSLRVQLVEYLSKDPSLNVLDLTSVLRAHATTLTDNIYRKTDTHWNGRGVWRAYTEIVKKLRPAFPNIRDITDHFERFDETRGGGGDLARLLGLQHTLLENWTGIQLRKYRARLEPPPPYVDSSKADRKPNLFSQSDIDAPSLLVFHDSFSAVQFKQMLAESFSKALFMWHSVRQDIPWNTVAKFGPDIVVHEFVERTLAQEDFSNFLDIDFPTTD